MSATKHDITITQVPVNEIEAHPDNANKGDIAAITESVRINGFYSALIVQSSTGYILAGNHRYFAALALGYEEVPVIYLDVDDEEAKRIMIVDNRTTRLGHDDTDLLRIVLEELGDSDVGLLGTGYTHADLQTLQDAADKFDPALLDEPTPEGGHSTDASEYAIEALEGAGGTCSGFLIVRYDKEPLTPEDYNRVRVALGLGRATAGQIASTGIEDWS
jgi:hypothetical protein